MNSPTMNRGLWATALAACLLMASGTAGCGANNTADSPEAQLYADKSCASCHGTNGEGRVGPSLVDLFGSTVSVTVDGGDKFDVVADADYLRESIVDPQAKITVGYRSPMPTVNLTPQEVDLLVDYIESLSSAEPDEGGG